MYGRRAFDLLQETAEQQGLPLPPYKEEAVRQVAEEIDELFKVMSESMRMTRLQQIQTYRWEIGSILPETVKSAMSANEREFFQNYDKLVGDYMVGVGLDLTSQVVPPKDLYIEVRVLTDHGEIMTDNGSLKLVKNTTHFLPRADVEHLIRQGILEHVV